MSQKQIKLSWIVDRACEFEGIPYGHNGRSYWKMDCTGLLIVLAKEFNIPHESPAVAYSPQGYNRALEDTLDKYLIRNEYTDILPGDIGLFWWDRHTKEPQHTGLFVRMETGEIGIVHSYLNVGKVVRHHMNHAWRKRLIRTYRFPPPVVRDI